MDAIVNSSPRLLLDEEWPTVLTAIEKLRTLYSSEDDIAALVQLNPVILHQDVHYVIAELQRCVFSPKRTRALRPWWLVGRPRAPHINIACVAFQL